MHLSEVKAKHSKIKGVYCVESRRVAFFRAPTGDEFANLQMVDAGDREAVRQANADYVRQCFIGSSPMPTKEPPTIDDYDFTWEEADPWFDKLVALEGPGVVHTSWLNAVGLLCGNGAKRTVSF